MSCNCPTYYGCGPFIEPITPCPPTVYTLSDTIKYNGADLPCTGIINGDSLTTILQKIEEKICQLQGAVVSTTTTTSTSTSTTTEIPSTTSTTTTSIPCFNNYTYDAVVTPATQGNNNGEITITITGGTLYSFKLYSFPSQQELSYIQNVSSPYTFTNLASGSYEIYMYLGDGCNGWYPGILTV